MSQSMPGLPKKMVPLMILEILRKETDGEHHLTQKEIGEKMLKRYELSVDRKAVKRNIDNLIDMGFPIEYSRSTRMMPNQDTGELEENTTTSDYWYVHDFTESELRLLIDGLLFSKHIPYNQCRELVDKLGGSQAATSSRMSAMFTRCPLRFPRTLSCS